MDLSTADDGQEPARATVELPVLSVGEEEVGAAHRAERERVDAFRRDARLDELPAVRLMQVYERMTRRGRLEKRVGVRELRAKGFDDFSADLVAATERGRAERGADGPRVCIKLLAARREQSGR